ncbi:hypothetical protein ABZ297_17585 [Nonomuraea sp. NPDC005983]|uniref:hypothetical protein n=1 Tax=Nonomuraea sp. NPDC005983 TaxID=3155595 RepID=UPI0033AB84BB
MLAVAIAAPAAYAPARRRSRTSSALTVAFAMGLGVPGQVLVVQFNGVDYGIMVADVCIILAPMLALSWMGSRIVQGMTIGIGT